MKKRKVLIPLDGSEFSTQIIRIVPSWFKPEEDTLVLLRVTAQPPPLSNPTIAHRFVGNLPEGGFYATYSHELDQMHALGTQEVETLRTELQADLHKAAECLSTAGYMVTTTVSFGDPVQRIIELVKADGIDLVAMTTHGRTGLGRLAMGSVAESVVRAVSIPVLLLRPSLKPGEIQPTAGKALAQGLANPQTLRVAVAIDSSAFGQTVVNLAGDLAKQLKTKLNLLVIASEHDAIEYRQRLMHDATQWTENLAPGPTLIPLVGFADEGLLRYLDKNPQELLIIGAFRDRGAGSPNAIGTTAHRLVQYAPTSVLMVKNHPEKLSKLLVCAALDDHLVIEVAGALAKLIGAQLDVLHVMPTPAGLQPASSASGEVAVNELLAQATPLAHVLRGWAERLEALGFSRENLHVRGGNIAESILTMAHTGAYDLVITGSQSGAGTFLGSVANSIVSFAHQSVLVVRTRS